MHVGHVESENNMTIHDAISRSKRHNEIATIRAANNDDARSLIDEAKRIAESAGLEFDSTDSNEGHDLWAYDPADNSDDMAWRISLVIAGK